MSHKYRPPPSHFCTDATWSHNGTIHPLKNTYNANGTISLHGAHLSPDSHTIQYSSIGDSGHLVTDFDSSSKFVGAIVGQITGGTGAFAGEFFKRAFEVDMSGLPVDRCVVLEVPTYRPVPARHNTAGVKGVISSSDYVDENGNIISYMSVVTDKDV